MPKTNNNNNNNNSVAAKKSKKVSGVSSAGSSKIEKKKHSSSGGKNRSSSSSFAAAAASGSSSKSSSSKKSLANGAGGIGSTTLVLEKKKRGGPLPLDPEQQARNLGKAKEVRAMRKGIREQLTCGSLSIRSVFADPNLVRMRAQEVLTAVGMDGPKARKMIMTAVGNANLKNPNKLRLEKFNEDHRNTLFAAVDSFISQRTASLALRQAAQAANVSVSDIVSTVTDDIGLSGAATTTSAASDDFATSNGDHDDDDDAHVDADGMDTSS